MLIYLFIWCICIYNVYLFFFLDLYSEDCLVNIYKFMVLLVLFGLCVDFKLVNEYVFILEK